jgi:hypothetical protein
MKGWRHVDFGVGGAVAAVGPAAVDVAIQIEQAAVVTVSGRSHGPPGRIPDGVRSQLGNSGRKPSKHIFISMHEGKLAKVRSKGRAPSSVEGGTER